MDNDRSAPATKGDIYDVKLEVAGVKLEITGVKTEITGVKTEVTDLKTEITDLKTEITDKFADVKQEFAMVRSEMQHSFDHLTETMRDGQTELLKAFYGYTQSNNERVQAAESEAASLKKRLGIVEARITDVERRLMTPPPQ